MRLRHPPFLTSREIPASSIPFLPDCAVVSSEFYPALVLRLVGIGLCLMSDV